jgi:hypothetical protein
MNVFESVTRVLQPQLYLKVQCGRTWKYNHISFGSTHKKFVETNQYGSSFKDWGIQWWKSLVILFYSFIAQLTSRIIVCQTPISFFASSSPLRFFMLPRRSRAERRHCACRDKSIPEQTSYGVQGRQFWYFRYPAMIRHTILLFSFLIIF